MPMASAGSLARRLSAARLRIAAESLDVLLVSHLPNIRYLTGFGGSAGMLVLAPDRAVLAVDGRYRTAAASLPGAAAGLFEVDVAERQITDAVVACVRALAPARVGIEASYMPVAAFNTLQAALADGAGTAGASGRVPLLVATERLIETARMVKDAEEIGTLREAARRLSHVARSLPDMVRPGLTEREVAAAIDAAVRAAGFERAAFETIAAAGPNGALPHARPTDRPLRAGEGVVLDFGGVYDGYCVDLTRTLHIGARPAPFRRLFAAVAEAHAAAVAAVRPGVRTSAVDAAARGVLEQHGLGEAFSHGTGHGLGLEIHEEPRLTRAGTAHHDVVVEPGMVFTIEPGAYVPGVGGVRLEDDVLVREDGAELLTDVPIDLDAGGRDAGE